MRAESAQESALNVLDAFNAAFRSDVLVEPDFYANNDAVQRYFHTDNIYRVPYPDTPDHLKREGLGMIKNHSEPGDAANHYFFDVDIHRTFDIAGRIRDASVLGNFVRFTNLVSFEDAVRIFGAGWTEDKQAEMRLALAMGEYFNPPATPTTHRMGNAIISYVLESGGVKKTLTLQFASNGYLRLAKIEAHSTE